MILALQTKSSLIFLRIQIYDSFELFVVSGRVPNICPYFQTKQNVLKKERDGGIIINIEYGLLSLVVIYYLLTM